MKKKLLKLFVFVMIFGMIFPLPISAEESNLSNAQDEPVLYVPEYLPGDLTHEQLKTAVLPINERSDFISAAQVEEKHHVNRIYEQEPDEYTIMFQNGDGGKTAYIFSIPVKTANADGTFTDKSASQIISEQSQIMTLSIPGKLEATAPETSTSLKFLSEKLTAYIEANDIKSYQMLAPEYKTNTLTSSGLIEDNLVINTGTTPSTQVMSVAVTSSDLAGEYTISYATSANFLACNNGSIAIYDDTNAPYTRWLLKYGAYGCYAIQPQSYQGHCLANSSLQISLPTYTEADLDEDISKLWSISYDEEDGYSFYCADFYLTNELNFVSSQPSGNDSIYWDLYSRSDSFIELTSITLTSEFQTYPIGCSFMPTFTVSTGAGYASSINDFQIYSTNTNVVIIEGNRFKTLAGGSAEVYLKHKYSSVTSNRITVSAALSGSLSAGRTHLIRPCKAPEKLLTLSTDTTNGNTPSLYLNEWLPTWDDYSQAFVINNDAINNNVWGITAILSTNQYTARSGNTYNATDKCEKPNTIITNETNTVIALAKYNDVCQNGDFSTEASWNIETEGDISHIYKLKDGVRYYLVYNLNTNTIGISTSSTNAGWLITTFGLDVPVIQQITSYYCGAASCAQVAAYTNPNLTNYYSLQNNIWNSIMINETSTTPSHNKMATYLKPYYGGVCTLQFKNTGLELINSLDKFIVRLKGSLTDNNPPVIGLSMSNMTNLTYYNGYNPESGHFVTGIGYDSLSGKILISDCHYEDDYFGLHIENETNVFNAFSSIHFKRTVS